MAASRWATRVRVWLSWLGLEIVAASVRDRSISCGSPGSAETRSETSSAAAASAGVTKAQSTALGTLYGATADVTATGPVLNPPSTLLIGTVQPGTKNGKLAALDAGFSVSKVTAAARLPGVAAAAGGIVLQDWKRSGDILQGVDTGHLALGPLGSATLVSGHSFTAANADADVAVVDAGYARSHRLKTGAGLTIEGIRLTVIGVVRQAAGDNPPGVYVPLNVARDVEERGAVPSGYPSLKGEVTNIYLTAASAADVPEVTREVTRLLPGGEVDNASSLASEVTGSLASFAKLANDLGRWLAVLVLIAAFAVASLLTMAAVARRAAEFGTLKAFGWRTRRIIAQVLGESLATGIAGAAAGIALGYAGAAIIAAVMPSVWATAGGSTLPPGIGKTIFLIGASPVQTVAAPLHPSVSIGVIVLAVVLALAGALLAGSFASSRIARLRPADALSRVA